MEEKEEFCTREEALKRTNWADSTLDKHTKQEKIRRNLILVKLVSLIMMKCQCLIKNSKVSIIFLVNGLSVAYTRLVVVD